MKEKKIEDKETIDHVKRKKIKKKKREERTWNSGRCAEGREKKMRKSDRSFGTKVFSGLMGGHFSKIAGTQFSSLAFPPKSGGKKL